MLKKILATVSSLLHKITWNKSNIKTGWIMEELDIPLLLQNCIGGKPLVVPGVQTKDYEFHITSVLKLSIVEIDNKKYLTSYEIQSKNEEIIRSFEDRVLTTIKKAVNLKNRLTEILGGIEKCQ